MNGMHSMTTCDFICQTNTGTESLDTLSLVPIEQFHMYVTRLNS